jgi:hypothetical protein
MTLQERVITYNVRVDRTDFGAYTRLLEVRLESGTIGRFEFDPQPPGDWLQFSTGAFIVSMAEAQFADAYQILRSEQSVFCTAINLFGIRVGAIHTALDLTQGDPAHPAYREDSMEAVIVRAQRQAEQP